MAKLRNRGGKRFLIWSESHNIGPLDPSELIRGDSRSTRNERYPSTVEEITIAPTAQGAPLLIASAGSYSADVSQLDDTETRKMLWSMLTGEEEVPERKKGTVEKYSGFLEKYLDKEITKEKLDEYLNEEE